MITFKSLYRKIIYIDGKKKLRLFLDFGRTFCFLTSELKKKVVNFHVHKGPPLRFFTILGKNDQTPIKKISSKT